MKTIVLDCYGVRSRLPDDVDDVLELADEFRRAYCQLQQQRHNRFIELRNAHFPELLTALERHELAKAVCYRLDAEIKAHHSEVRDRNAVTDELRTALIEAREERSAAQAAAKIARQPWFAVQRAFACAWSRLADWQQVKSLEKRRELYQTVSLPTKREEFAALAAEIQRRTDAAKAPQKRRKSAAQPPFDASTFTPETVAAYADIWREMDLQERELSVEYQRRGLHSAIRGEIVEASQPKTGPTAPGMWYRYGRTPEPRPWRKLSLHFSGGLTIEKATQGQPNFAVDWTPGDRLAIVRQQIGTRTVPRMIEYSMRMHRLWPDDAVLKRWTLCIERETVLHINLAGQRRFVQRLRATVQPVATTATREKPRGDGVLSYRLKCSVVDGGVRVAEFAGTHVRESLVIPTWLFSEIFCDAAAQRRCDEQANGLLAMRAVEGKLTGVAALQKYVDDRPADSAAVTLLEDCDRALYLARRRSRRGRRRLADLYANVAAKVCRLHDYVIHDDLDLASVKRYDTRDLLRIDRLPVTTRTLLQAASPGKLRLAIQRYGLPTAEAPTELPTEVRDDTDVIARYVARLRPPTRRQRQKAFPVKKKSG